MFNPSQAANFIGKNVKIFTKGAYFKEITSQQGKLLSITDAYDRGEDCPKGICVYLNLQPLTTPTVKSKDMYLLNNINPEKRIAKHIQEIPLHSVVDIREK